MGVLTNPLVDNDWELVEASGALVLLGTRGPDRISGSARNDQIFAEGSNDHVFGLSGNDDIHGQMGNDVLSGGNGDDTLRGGIGRDTLSGGAHQDLLLGGSGPESAKVKKTATITAAAAARASAAWILVRPIIFPVLPFGRGGGTLRERPCDGESRSARPRPGDARRAAALTPT